MSKMTVLGCSILTMASAFAATVVDVTGTGVQKTAVQVNVGNAAFSKCLARNLELSGLFEVRPTGAIKVSGNGTAIRAEGAGKVVTSTAAFSDDRSARMAARRLSDAMCEAYGKQKGFACDKIVFLRRGKQPAIGTALPGDLCTCYPDGMDIRQLTNDGKMGVFPRWKGNGESIFYICDRNGAPQIWEMNAATERASVPWSFKGSPAGIAPSPDGSRFAAVLSHQGNVELYVIEPARDRLIRLTTTPHEVEGQPTWSPDGRQIAFVRGTKNKQIWVIDVATKQERRLTSRGSQNIDPDWGKDGRIAYISRRGGAYVAVMSATAGDASAQLVTDAANWEHPSWSRDNRHLVANRDKALFVIDTLEGGDKPKQMFYANGNWMSPSWIK